MYANPKEIAFRLVRLLCGVGATLILVASASAQDSGNVTRVAVERTATVKSTGAVSVVESRIYYIQPDGKYRVETTRNGLTSADIVDPGSATRTRLDLQSHKALVASDRVPMLPPQAASAGPSGARLATPPATSLGTRTVFGIALEGTQLTTYVTRPNSPQLVQRREIWTYRFSDPRIPMIALEHKYEDDYLLEQSRIIDVAAVVVDPGLFEIPSNFSVERLP